MTFFQLYKQYTDKTEPPPNYHFWSAISAIGALLGKKAYMPQGHFTIFPNTYIILCGGPGMRKSTALNVAKNLVRLCDRVPVAPESATRESMIDFMAAKKVDAVVEGKEMPYWQAAVFAGELEQFFGGKHINQQMVAFLTAIWDEPKFVERTRKGGEVIINNPYFSLLACCTPTWVSTKLKQDVISDGFSRRAIFILEKDLHCLNPRPTENPEDAATLRQLMIEVNRIHKISGEFKLTAEAEVLWDSLYVEFRDRATLFSERLQSYWSSRHVLMAKIAMCISAGIRNDRIIDSAVLMTADLCLSEAESRFEEVFAGIGRNELKAYQDKIVNFVGAQKDPVSFGEIAVAMTNDLNKQELGEALDILVAMGELQAQASSTDFRYSLKTARTPVPAKNLLELVSRTRLSPERPGQALTVSSSARPSDLIAAQSLAARKAREDAERSGTLLRGTLRELRRKYPESEQKEVDRLLDGTSDAEKKSNPPSP